MFMVMWENGIQNSKVVARIGNIVDDSHWGILISVTDKTLENKVDAIILCHQKVRLSDVAYQANMAYGPVQNITTKKKLKYRKICGHWTPDTVTAKRHAGCVVTCKKNLDHFRKEGNVLLNHTVTVNESRCHYHIMTSKQFSMTWWHKNLLRAMKTRSKTLAGKEMLMLFFNVPGLVLVKWMPKGITIKPGTHFSDATKNIWYRYFRLTLTYFLDVMWCDAMWCGEDLWFPDFCRVASHRVREV